MGIIGFEEKSSASLVGGFNPIERNESKWLHLPQIGMKIPKIFELPPPRSVHLFKSGRRWVALYREASSSDRSQFPQLRFKNEKFPETLPSTPRSVSMQNTTLFLDLFGCDYKRKYVCLFAGFI